MHSFHPLYILVHLCIFSLKFGITELLESRIHDVESDVGEGSEQKIEFIGKSELYPLETFNGISNHRITSSVHTIHIENYFFEPNDLLKDLENHPKLGILILKNVDWNGYFTRKIQLKNLTKFYISRQQWDFVLSSAKDILSCIFFEISSTISEIRIEADMGNSLTYFPATKKLILVEDPYSLFQYFKYETLELKSCIFDVARFNGSGVRKISSEHSELINGKLGNVLMNCIDLVDLELATKFGDIIDICLLPSVEKLQHLIITRGQLICSTSHDLQLRNLINFQLRFAIIDIEMFKITSNITQNVDLRHIHFVRGSYRTLLSNMTALATLQISSIPSRTDFDISILQPSSKSLTHLLLRNLHLKQSEWLEFKKLEKFTLSNCTFGENVIQHFSATFKFVRQVLLEYKAEDSLVDAILNTSVCQLTLMGYQHMSTPKLEHLVTNAGAPLYWEQIDLKRVNNTWKNLNLDKNWRHNIRIRDAAIYSYFFILLSICIIGTLGNLASILVLLRKSIRSSTSYMLLTLTFCDTLVVVAYIPSILHFATRLVFGYFGFSLFYDYYEFLGYHITYAVSEVWCKMHGDFLYPLSKTAYAGSVFVTILLTVERYIVVRWPMESRNWMNVKKSVGFSIAAILFAILLNLPRWFEGNMTKTQVFEYIANDVDRKLIKISAIPKPGSLLRQRIYMEYYHVVLWLSLIYVLPISLLCVLNFLIWHELKLSSTRRRLMVIETGHQRTGLSSQTDKDQRTTTKILLTIVAIFLVSNIISGCFVIYFVLILGLPPLETEAVSAIPHIVNSSVNFIIYAMVGKKFRNEFRKLFPTLCTRKLVVGNQLNNKIQLSAITTSITQTETQF